MATWKEWMSCKAKKVNGQSLKVKECLKSVPGGGSTGAGKGSSGVQQPSSRQTLQVVQQRAS